MSASVQTTTAPRAASVPTRRTARALVDPLANQPDAVAGHQVVDRAVSGCVIDNDDLPRVPARLQARSNSSEFGVKMAGLVVDGEYDGDIQLGRR